MHGGKSLRGRESPSFKTGRYSRDLPTRLLNRYQEALKDPQLLSVKSDVAVLQAVIDDKLAAWAQMQDDPNWEAVAQQAQLISENWQGWDWTRMEGELRILTEAVSQRRAEATVFAEIRDLMNQRAKLAKQEQKRILELNQVMTPEQAVLLASALAAAVTKHVEDLDIRRAINADIMAALSVPERKAMPG